MGAARQPDQLRGRNCCPRAGEQSLSSPTGAATATGAAVAPPPILFYPLTDISYDRLHGRGGAARRPGHGAGGQDCALPVARRWLAARHRARLCQRCAFSHVVAYNRRTMSLPGTADTLFDTASYGSRWVLLSRWPWRRVWPGPFDPGPPDPKFEFGRWLVTAPGPGP